MQANSLKLRRKRARHFTGTAAFVFCLAVLAAIAYGVLGNFGVSDDPATPQPAAMQANGFPVADEHVAPQPTATRENRLRVLDDPATPQPAATRDDDARGHSANPIADGGDRTTAWNLILVNQWHPIPDGYDVELIQLSNGQTVDARIYPELQNMFDAARSEGVYPVVAAGYRTAEEQQSLLDEKIAGLEAEGRSPDGAKKEAERWVAVPGTSEHQLGIAVDINGDGVQSAGFEVFEWLSKNAWKYGFILRYPPDKTGVTGVRDEPWHYRYVGKEAAAQIYRQGLCLEEYLNGNP